MFTIGDYVVADHALYDDFSGITWRVVARRRNMLGHSCIQVERADRPGPTTLFYPHELSWTDGSRPNPLT